MPTFDAYRRQHSSEGKRYHRNEAQTCAALTVSRVCLQGPLTHSPKHIYIKDLSFCIEVVTELIPFRSLENKYSGLTTGSCPPWRVEPQCVVFRKLLNQPHLSRISLRLSQNQQYADTSCIIYTKFIVRLATSEIEVGCNERNVTTQPLRGEYRRAAEIEDQNSSTSSTVFELRSPI